MGAIEGSEVDPHRCAPLSSDGGGRAAQYRKKSLSNSGCWSRWIAKEQGVNYDPSRVPCIKLHSKWIRDVSLKHEAMEVF